MSILLFFGIVVAAIYFGKSFLEKVGLFVVLYAGVLIFQSLSAHHAFASFEKSIPNIQK